MPRPTLRHLACLGVVFCFVFGAGLHAQAPIMEEPDYKPTLTFDVATIRLAPPPDANFHVSVSSPPHSSRFEATNLPIKTLIQIAYGFEAPVVGAPDWVANIFYNIQARSDEAADARLMKITDNEVRLEKRNAIRVLLAERLGLKTHAETRTTSIYNLTVAKGGVKMQVVPPPPSRQWRSAAATTAGQHAGPRVTAWTGVRWIERVHAGHYGCAELDGRGTGGRQDRAHRHL